MNDNHELTNWGNALQLALTQLDPNDKLEESVFLAVELIRLNVLRASKPIPPHPDAPLRDVGE
jgi:hypothetical protein